MRSDSPLEIIDVIPDTWLRKEEEEDGSYHAKELI